MNTSLSSDNIYLQPINSSTLWLVGFPLRRSSLSMQGRSSWMRDMVCNISMAQAAGMAVSSSPPKSSQAAKQSTGRTLFPPAKSEYRIASRSFTGCCNGTALSNARFTACALATIKARKSNLCGSATFSWGFSTSSTTCAVINGSTAAMAPVFDVAKTLGQRETTPLNGLRVKRKDSLLLLLTGTARPQVILPFDCDTIVPEATIAIDPWELPAITAIPISPSLPSSASSSLMDELRAKARTRRRATKEPSKVYSQILISEAAAATEASSLALFLAGYYI